MEQGIGNLKHIRLGANERSWLACVVPQGAGGGFEKELGKLVESLINQLCNARFCDNLVGSCIMVPRSLRNG